MLSKAMEWIRTNTTPDIREIDGASWSDRPMHKIRNIMSMEKSGIFHVDKLGRVPAERD